MRSRIAILIMMFAAILLPTADVLAQDDVECPSCLMTMYWTGKTKTEWGKLFKLYKCPSQHAYWVPWETKQRNDYQSKRISPKCPVCEMDTYWTGKTRTEWGQLQKIYKCPAGHVSVGKF